VAAMAALVVFAWAANPPKALASGTAATPANAPPIAVDLQGGSAANSLLRAIDQACGTGPIHATVVANAVGHSIDIVVQSPAVCRGLGMRLPDTARPVIDEVR